MEESNKIEWPTTIHVQRYHGWTVYTLLRSEASVLANATILRLMEPFLVTADCLSASFGKSFRGFLEHDTTIRRYCWLNQQFSLECLRAVAGGRTNVEIQKTCIEVGMWTLQETWAIVCLGPSREDIWKSNVWMDLSGAPNLSHSTESLDLFSLRLLQSTWLLSLPLVLYILFPYLSLSTFAIF